MKVILFVFFILVQCSFLYAQDQNYVDSLQNVINTTKSDTTKANIAHKLFLEYVLSDTAKAKFLCQQIKTLSEENKYKKGTMIYYYDMGIYHFYHGNYPLSISFYEKSILLRKELKDKKGESASLNNIGLCYASQGDFVKAIDYYLKSLKIDETLGNLRGVSDSYANIGVIQYQQNNYAVSISYYQKSLEILKELLQTSSNTFEKKEINKGISSNYTNIGLVYYSQKNLNKALEFYNKSLKMVEEMGDKQGMSQGYNNIGMVYEDIGNINKALEYYLKAVTLLEEIGDKGGVVVVLGNIANQKNKLQKYNEGIIYAEKCMKISKELGSLDDERLAWIQLSKSYKGLKNFEKALDCYQKSMHIKDSIFNIEKNKQFSEMEAKYNNEKKQKEIELLNANKELQKIEVRSLTIQKYAFIFGFILMLTLAFVSFRSFRQKRKANLILSKQKLEIEERNEELHQQNEEILTQRDEIEAQRDLVSNQKKQIETIYSSLTDSIHYAERIQKAVLPSSEYMDSLLKDYFILFKPKDIVSGDFYYVAKRNHFIIAAVADCTGHGVPGAFMSMLGVSFLNEIIAKENIKQANQVLNELRYYVVKSLQQKGVSGEQKDGMDISFVVIDTHTNTLQFSGANSPLYIVKSTKMKSDERSPSDFRLDELKGDKMPVSIYINMDEFTNHAVKTQPDDIIYLFSDGFSDQFGGSCGKKFFSKRFKELLAENADKPMKLQKEVLNKAIEEWKTASDKIYPQTDDITVMGIKL